MHLHRARVLATLKRVWRPRLATHVLLRKSRCSGVQLSSIIGHYTFSYLLRRPCLSVFGAVYQFIEKASSKVWPLWGFVPQGVCFRCQQKFLCSDA